MADVHTPEWRSYNMSRIKSKNTNPEMVVRRYLYQLGFRYRLHVKTLPGNPDLVIRKYNTVIFIHGCFWHGHANCKYYKPPRTRAEFWQLKISRNQTRDEKNIQALLALGYK